MANDLSVIEIDANGGAPRLEVLLENIDAASVTIRRTSAGRPFLVRGAVNRAVTGGFTVVDFECPFNMPVQYRAELFDDMGVSLGFSNAFTIGDGTSALYPADYVFPDVDVFPSGLEDGLPSAFTWVHNPLDPENAVKISLRSNAAGSINRPVSGGAVFPKGRRVGVMVTEPRGGVRGLVLDAWVESLQDADKIQSMVGSYTESTVPVLCVRLGGTESRVRLPQPLFLGVQDIPEEMVDVQWGGQITVQRIQGDEVDPPTPGLFIPLLTRADLNAYYATRAAKNADNASRLAVNRRYDLAGSA